MFQWSTPMPIIIRIMDLKDIDIIVLNTGRINFKI